MTVNQSCVRLHLSLLYSLHYNTTAVPCLQTHSVFPTQSHELNLWKVLPLLCSKQLIYCHLAVQTSHQKSPWYLKLQTKHTRTERSLDVRDWFRRIGMRSRGWHVGLPQSLAIVQVTLSSVKTFLYVRLVALLLGGMRFWIFPSTTLCIFMLTKSVFYYT